MKNITILGSTGSIGRSTLEVIAQNRDDFSVFALTAHTQIELLFKQCLEFQPRFAVVATDQLADVLSHKLKATACKTEVLSGEAGLIEVAAEFQVDLVMAAIVGIAGLKPTYAAVTAGKTVLLANKEVLVTAGEIFMNAVAKYRATLIPVDSEHNAIFQCLEANNKKYDDKAVSEIILTASGGPFRDKTLNELHAITPAEACDHPNWQMGRKISIDSSTMVNKALEIIEAYWLFTVPADKIKVLIHRQSIVHSMVKYHDGSYLAQMGSPDMKTPIGFALYYPHRHGIDVPSLDLTAQNLSFEALDMERFKAVAIVFELLRRKDYGGTIIFNAINEVLVERFLQGRIAYLDIIAGIEQGLDAIRCENPETIDDVMAIDRMARAYFT
ncbi:MAG: 1-deoxy-D-xylulose-5-phosphate reductoisomerase [Francisellaceae bacterium]